MRSKRRTFLDAGVLILAATGRGQDSLQALQILDDPDREFISSIFLQLEVLPKARYYKRTAEAQYYEEFFSAVAEWIAPNEIFFQEADHLATAHGLSALDALHVAAAMMAQADEFVTTEKAGKPIYRITQIQIISIAN